MSDAGKIVRTTLTEDQEAATLAVLKTCGGRDFNSIIDILVAALTMLIDGVVAEDKRLIVAQGIASALIANQVSHAGDATELGHA